MGLEGGVALNLLCREVVAVGSRSGRPESLSWELRERRYDSQHLLLSHTDIFILFKLRVLCLRCIGCC